MKVAKWKIGILGSYAFWVLWMTCWFVVTIAERSVIYQALNFFWLLSMVAILTGFTIDIFVIEQYRVKNHELIDKIWEQSERIFKLEKLE